MKISWQEESKHFLRMTTSSEVGQKDLKKTFSQNIYVIGKRFQLLGKTLWPKIKKQQLIFNKWDLNSQNKSS